MVVVLSCPVLGVCSDHCADGGEGIVLLVLSLSHTDAPTQGSVRVDEEQKAIRNGAFGWLFRTLSCVNIIILYTRHRIPPSTILLLMIVPDECYQHTDTPHAPPHMPSKALRLNQTIVAADKEPTKDQQKKAPNKTPDSGLFCLPGSRGRSRGDSRLDSLRPAPGMLSLNLRGRLLSTEPVL